MMLDGKLKTKIKGNVTKERYPRKPKASYDKSF